MSENQHNFGTYGSFYFFYFRVTYEGLLVACEDEVKKRFSMIAALLMQFTQLTVDSICEIRNQSTHHNKMLAVYISANQGYVQICHVDKDCNNCYKILHRFC